MHCFVCEGLLLIGKTVEGALGSMNVMSTDSKKLGSGKCRRSFLGDTHLSAFASM